MYFFSIQKFVVFQRLKQYLHEKGYKHFRRDDLINIYEYIKAIMYYTGTHVEQEYNILMCTGILLDINKHLCFTAEFDTLATQENYQ